jgi:hypothetical protein
MGCLTITTHCGVGSYFSHDKPYPSRKMCKTMLKKWRQVLVKKRLKIKKGFLSMGRNSLFLAKKGEFAPNFARQQFNLSRFSLT